MNECTVFIEMKLLLLLKISNAIKQQTPEITARIGKIILTAFSLVAVICIFISKHKFKLLQSVVSKSTHE